MITNNQKYLVVFKSNFFTVSLSGFVKLFKGILCKLFFQMFCRYFSESYFTVNVLTRDLNTKQYKC